MLKSICFAYVRPPLDIPRPSGTSVRARGEWTWELHLA